MGTALFIVFAVLVLMGIPLAFCLSGSALLAFADHYCYTKVFYWL